MMPVIILAMILAIILVIILAEMRVWQNMLCRPCADLNFLGIYGII
ncbi:MAG: hypothetical protein ACPIC4_05040 [Candidatus Puniceispirillaceae bacterium]